MAGIHAIIGLGEALITSLVIVSVARLRPELLQESAELEAKPAYGQLLAYGLIVVLGLVLFVAPFASAWPDGLEKVAEALGFSGAAMQQAVANSPIPDYQVPGVGSSVISNILAGLLGTLIVFVLSYVLARLLTSKSNSTKSLT